jgi:hypothetical protein
MDADELTKVRIGRNQSTFRTANDHIEARAEDIAFSGEIIPFLCECADTECTQIVRLAPAVYADIRSDPRRFVNAPGHESLSVDAGASIVLEVQDEYVIVEKIGTAGDVAASEYGEPEARAHG